MKFARRGRYGRNSQQRRAMLKIIFEFVGGPQDGKVLEGQLGDGGEADRYYLFTNRGTIGQRIKVASDYAVETLAEEHLQEEKPHHFQPHHYVVTDRIEEDGEVLVRAEYVEQDAKRRPRSLVRDHLEPTAGPEPLPEQVRRFLEQTAKLMTRSYSHYWPAAGTTDMARHESLRNLLAMHLGNVLLNERFGILLDVGPPATTATAAGDVSTSETGGTRPSVDFPGGHSLGVDLLAIAPSQDWFVAAGLLTMEAADSRPLVQQAEQLAQRLDSLATFWLHPKLTIPPCSEHLGRVARHCEHGFGLLAAVHRVPAEPTDWIRFWTDTEPPAESLQRLAEICARRNVTRLPPLRIQHYPGWGTYYLLAAFFEIPRG